MTKQLFIKMLLTKNQLNTIRSKSDMWGALLVIHSWGLIIASVTFVVFYPNILTHIFAILIIGSRQLGLLILMHDSAHGTLFRSKKLNYLIGQYACAFPMFADIEVYRKYHMRHHLNTQLPNDPDINLTSKYPISRKSLLRKFMRDLTGLTAFHQRVHQISFALGKSDMKFIKRLRFFWTNLGRQIICNIIIFSILLCLGYGWLYLTLWILPLLTWHQLVLRIRNIAEHAVVGSADDSFRNTRTIIVGFWGKVFIAPYWVNYHLEHHLIMWVPCYRLHLLHQFLIKNGFKEKMEIETGYLKLLKKVTVKNPDNPNTGNKSRNVGTFSDGFKV